MEILMIWWIVLSMFVGWFASTKNHSGIDFFFISLILTPIVGVSIALIMKENYYKYSKDIDKKCPRCAELIKKEALVCRFCSNEEFPEPEPPQLTPPWC